jgi:hypothetical protein
VIADLALLAVAAGLIAANAVFVAAEFSLVTVERGQLRDLAAAGDRGARGILAAVHRLSFQLSGAQLGITITSRSLYSGDSGAHRPRSIRGRRLPPLNGWSLPPRRHNPARSVNLTRHQQEFPGSRAIPVLPLTCGHHGWSSGPWAFP